MAFDGTFSAQKGTFSTFVRTTHPLRFARHHCAQRSVLTFGRRHMHRCSMRLKCARGRTHYHIHFPMPVTRTYTHILRHAYKLTRVCRTSSEAHATASGSFNIITRDVSILCRFALARPISGAHTHWHTTNYTCNLQFKRLCAPVHQWRSDGDLL